MKEEDRRLGALGAVGSRRRFTFRGTRRQPHPPLASDVIQGGDGAQTCYFITTLTEDCLILRGRGDLALLDEIAGTLRALSEPDS